MKLWEAMKKLDENPNKVFKNRHGVKLTVKDGWASIDGRTTFPMEDVWEEVKQPVTWQEAILEYAKGNKVVVKFNNQEWTLGALIELPEYLNRAITNGTWYVED